jgi:hypothetical protein
LLLLDFTEEDDVPPDEDLPLLLDVIPAEVPGSPFLLLLDTLVSRSLDCGVTLDELLDFAFELLEPSQSSQADEDSFPSGRVAKSLSSSPQATNNVATTPIIKNFFKAINYTPTNHNIKFAEALRGQTQSQRLKFFF